MSAKELIFHADLTDVVIYVKGQPIQVQGEVDISVKRPTKMSRGNKNAWATITDESATAMSISLQKE